MTSMMNLGPFLGPYVFSLSMVMIPSMGYDAIFPVLMVIAAIVAIVGLVHSMKALTAKSPEQDE